MAGHIQDRWYKTEPDANGKPVRTKTDRHGTGLRYRARYVSPDGAEKSKSFPDGKKRLAEEWLSRIEADMSRGDYLDPDAGRVTFESYTTEWMGSQATDLATRAAVEMRLRRHAVPYIGHRSLASITPTHLRQWLRALEDAGLSAAYRRVIYAHVSTVFTAAVDDRLIKVNPCGARSVKAPRREPRKVKPWTAERVMALRAALPERYQAMVDPAAGCGLRQGEVFGLALEDLDFAGGVVHVVRQVKLLRNALVFAPPKGGKEREVPLADSVAEGLRRHLKSYPSKALTLPWKTPDGQPVTANLVFCGPSGNPLRRTRFNERVWRPALDVAGIEATRDNGTHALRHFYASVLLDAGENIKALSEYLGHHDPGFTLRTYTHLMPDSGTRSRAAVDSVYAQFGRSARPEGGPQAK